MSSRWIDIGHEGFRGYLAVPSAGTGPGLLLLHDVPGVDPQVEAIADGYAEEGYVVMTPDLFWRRRRSANDDADPQQGFDETRGMQDIAIALACLRTRHECVGKLGAIGYGFGGRLAFLAAARTDLDAAVAYCPVGLDALLAERTAIGCPIVLHFAAADTQVPPAARTAVAHGLADRPDARLYTYPGCAHRFHDAADVAFDKAAALMAYSRSLTLLRESLGPAYDLSALWEQHTKLEFGVRDAAATMQTMVAAPYVNHIPTMTGGVGQDDLLRFYRDHFIPQTPADTRLVPVSRTIGADRLVDEMLFCFTHDIEIDWMLPGIAPTGRYVEIPLVAIVRFRGDKLYNEHIYWDQASVLVQIGLLDPTGLPVAGVETAHKLLDETLPSNTLMARWANSAPPASPGAAAAIKLNFVNRSTDTGNTPVVLFQAVPANSTLLAAWKVIVNCPPGQQVPLVYTPAGPDKALWIAATPQAPAAGTLLDTATAAAPARLDLDVASADIIMTGGGPGPNAAPFRFTLENVVPAPG